LSNPPHRYLILALLFSAVFILGLTRLFLLRFESGDVYPPYSSLRSDPLGTRALYESLNTVLPGTAVRNHQPLHRIRLTPKSSLLICGLPADTKRIRGKLWESLMNQLAAEGGRIIIAFTDRVEVKPLPDKNKSEEPPDNEPPVNNEKGKEELEEETPWAGDVELGVEISIGDRKAPYRTLSLSSEYPHPLLPGQTPWHGSQHFILHHEEWRRVYSFPGPEDQSVIAVRAWGRGTLVVIADSYPFSNEALRGERATQLLTWLLAPGNEVLFDEFHNGIIKQPGILALAKKYGLKGIFLVLILLCLLFIWRQSAVFVPSRTDGETNHDDHIVVGDDTGQGLVNLIHRYIPPSELLKTCFDTWQASAAARHVSKKRIDDARKKMATVETSSDPVELYKQITDLLQQRKYQ
jgi:hypothetical protein